MRILYFYRGFVRSTQRIHIYAIIRAWRKLGHEVLECFPLSESAGDTSATPSRVRRAPRLLRNFAQIWADGPAAKALARACAEFHPDFIYERYALFSRCAGDVARRAGIPLIMEVNSAVAHLEPGQISPILRAWGRKRECHSLTAADALVTVSGFQAERLASLGLPSERILVTHNAVDPADFQDLARDRAVMRARLGIEDEFVLVLVQSWTDPKSASGALHILSRAAAALGSEADSLCLLCVGGGLFFPKVKEQMHAALPRAIFTDAIPHDQVYLYLAVADAGLIAWHESFTSPLKLFEYMAAGLPVIAPDLPNIAEVLRHGENGLLFRAGDARALADAIRVLRGDEKLRRSLGEAARREALEKYTWEANARKVLSLVPDLSSPGRTEAG